jgi:hypothetical protein
VIEPNDVDYYIEIRGVYGGWSAAKMKDGTLRNRWPVGDRRHAATQEWIDAAISSALSECSEPSASDGQG